MLSQCVLSLTHALCFDLILKADPTTFQTVASCRSACCVKEHVIGSNWFIGYSTLVVSPKASCYTLK